MNVRIAPEFPVAVVVNSQKQVISVVLMPSENTYSRLSRTYLLRYPLPFADTSCYNIPIGLLEQFYKDTHPADQADAIFNSFYEITDSTLTLKGYSSIAVFAENGSLLRDCLSLQQVVDMWEENDGRKHCVRTTFRDTSAGVKVASPYGQARVMSVAAVRHSYRSGITFANYNPKGLFQPYHQRIILPVAPDAMTTWQHTMTLSSGYSVKGSQDSRQLSLDEAIMNEALVFVPDTLSTVTMIHDQPSAVQGIKFPRVVPSLNLELSNKPNLRVIHLPLAVTYESYVKLTGLSDVTLIIPDGEVSLSNLTFLLNGCHNIRIHRECGIGMTVQRFKSWDSSISFDMPLTCILLMSVISSRVELPSMLTSALVLQMRSQLICSKAAVFSGILADTSEIVAPEIVAKISLKESWNVDADVKFSSPITLSGSRGSIAFAAEFSAWRVPLVYEDGSEPAIFEVWMPQWKAFSQQMLPNVKYKQLNIELHDNVELHDEVHLDLRDVHSALLSHERNSSNLCSGVVFGPSKKLWLDFMVIYDLQWLFIPDGCIAHFERRNYERILMDYLRDSGDLPQWGGSYRRSLQRSPKAVWSDFLKGRKAMVVVCSLQTWQQLLDEASEELDRSTILSDLWKVAPLRHIDIGKMPEEHFRRLGGF